MVYSENTWALGRYLHSKYSGPLATWALNGDGELCTRALEALEHSKGTWILRHEGHLGTWELRYLGIGALEQNVGHSHFFTQGTQFLGHRSSWVTLFSRLHLLIWIFQTTQENILQKKSSPKNFPLFITQTKNVLQWNSDTLWNYRY